MLAEIFMLRLEAAARAAKEAAATSSSSRFVLITLPVARGGLAPMKPEGGRNKGIAANLPRSER
jgi:hypothetical protein